MPEAVETMDGWYCLHDLRKIDWTKWKKASEQERKEAVDELQKMLREWEEVSEARDGSHAFYSIMGQKADIILMILRLFLWRFRKHLLINQNLLSSQRQAILMFQ